MPDKPNMFLKDFVLYKCVYCGLCKSIKKYGNLPRLATNYDSVFISVLMHNYLNIDYVIKKSNCMLHPLRRKPMAQVDNLNTDIGAMSVLLMYHKLSDDIIDKGGLKKRIMRLFFRRGYRRAKKTHPVFNEIITKQYNILRKLEQENCDSIDKAADAFANMLLYLSSEILKDMDCKQMQSIAYNIGRWIYLADAADDLESDFKKKNYNPYLAAFKDFENLPQFMEKHKKDIEFSMLCSSSKIREGINNLNFNFNIDLISNITEKGIPNRSRIILEGTKKCKKVRI